MNPLDEINTSEVESIELSIQNLIRNWYIRQRWQQFCLSYLKQQQDLFSAKARWRITLSHFLESNPVHIFTIVLLALEVILTTLELSSSLLSCTPAKKTDNGNAWYRWGGIVMLSLLAAKSIAIAVGMGVSFFRHPACLVDGAVAIGALVLEVLLERLAGGLIVVVSFWRVLRVVESAFELSDEAIEVQIEGVISQFKVLNDENRRLVETIAEKDEVIQKLSEELNQYKQNNDRPTAVPE